MLEKSQQIFADALLNPDTHEAVALSLFHGPSTLARRRLAFYRNNIYHAWEKALANVYPVLQALLGEDFFGVIASRYGLAYPSHSGDLNRFGAQFAAFLAEFTLVAPYPYAPSVARLEWQLHCAYYAADCQGLSTDDWASLTPEDAEMMRLTLHPACALLASDWAIVEIWHAYQPGAHHNLPKDIHRPNYGLVVRCAWRPEVLPLSLAAYSALAALQARQPLGIAVDAALAVDAHFDFEALLSQCVAHAVFVQQSKGHLENPLLSL